MNTAIRSTDKSTETKDIGSSFLSDIKTLRART